MEKKKGQTAGLQHVHPTWAGTFVLAALSCLFPGVEVSLLQNGLDKSSPTSLSEATPCPSSAESALKAPKLAMDNWHHRDVGQGILLVIEHNAEINAGFIVAFASSQNNSIGPRS